MKPDEAINLLNDLCERYTSLPTKRVRKLMKTILDEIYMLKKDNRRLRNKLKRERMNNERRTTN